MEDGGEEEEDWEAEKCHCLLFVGARDWRLTGCSRRVRCATDSSLIAFRRSAMSVYIRPHESRHRDPQINTVREMPITEHHCSHTDNHSLFQYSAQRCGYKYNIIVVNLYINTDSDSKRNIIFAL